MIKERKKKNRPIFTLFKPQRPQNDFYGFFNSFPPVYTYKFSMRQAIDEGFLTPYYYYPYFVNLDHDELEQYLEITRKLLKFFDFSHSA